MNIFVAGIGPGNYDLITLSAIEYAKRSDVILVPRADMKRMGISERVIRHYISDKKIVPLHFPMIRDEAKCVKELESQLSNQDWRGINNIFFPVIGDSVLYSTGEYLVKAFKGIDPEVKVEIIPGISAHSLASAYAGENLAMREEIFSVISGTASPERILASLIASDVTAIYKPKAVKNLRDLVRKSGEYSRILRIDYAGIPEKERIYEGIESLEDIREYMSIIILWKRT